MKKTIVAALSALALITAPTATFAATSNEAVVSPEGSFSSTVPYLTGGGLAYTGTFTVSDGDIMVEIGRVYNQSTDKDITGSYTLTVWVLDVINNKAYPVQHVNGYDNVAYFSGLKNSTYKVAFMNTEHTFPIGFGATITY